MMTFRYETAESFRGSCCYVFFHEEGTENFSESSTRVYHTTRHRIPDRNLWTSHLQPLRYRRSEFDSGVLLFSGRCTSARKHTYVCFGAKVQTCLRELLILVMSLTWQMSRVTRLVLSLVCVVDDRQIGIWCPTGLTKLPPSQRQDWLWNSPSCLRKE